jgi:hypothetical protein
MDIQPIVFSVPAAPVALPPPPKQTSIAAYLPWILVALFATVALWQFVPRGNEPGPTPVVIEQAVAELTTKNSKAYLAGVASVFDDLASKVESKQITNATQLQSNSRAATIAVREAAYQEVNAMDNDRVRGEYAGQEAAIAAYLRSKAEGYRRAAR